MIRTSMQLKAKIRNLSHNDGNKSQMLIRNFIMERFLERLSLSSYRNNFILKGGMLVASVTGLDTRATMDIDATVQGVTLSKEDLQKFISEIIEIDAADDIGYSIISIDSIMDDFEYPGFRINLEANLDRLRQPIQIDLSTDDVITPSAVEYQYPLMFEDRSINVMAYNLETLLAEKLQTVLARGTANTRLRDYYDLYILTRENVSRNIDFNLFRNAFEATCSKRKFEYDRLERDKLVSAIKSNRTMGNLWETYCSKNYYIVDVIPWPEVADNVGLILKKMGM